MQKSLKLGERLISSTKNETNPSKIDTTKHIKNKISDVPIPVRKTDQTIATNRHTQVRQHHPRSTKYQYRSQKDQKHRSPPAYQNHPKSAKEQYVLQGTNHNAAHRERTKNTQSLRSNNTTPSRHKLKHRTPSAHQDHPSSMNNLCSSRQTNQQIESRHTRALKTTLQIVETAQEKSDQKTAANRHTWEQQHTNSTIYKHNSHKTKRKKKSTPPAHQHHPKSIALQHAKTNEKHSTPPVQPNHPKLKNYPKRLLNTIQRYAKIRVSAHKKTQKVGELPMQIRNRKPRGKENEQRNEEKINL